MVPVLDQNFARRIEAVKDLILSEVNVKELELLEDTTGVLVKKIKPNFKTIGKKYGKHMKAIIANNESVVARQYYCRGQKQRLDRGN